MDRCFFVHLAVLTCFKISKSCHQFSSRVNLTRGEEGRACQPAEPAGTRNWSWCTVFTVGAHALWLSWLCMRAMTAVQMFQIVLLNVHIQYIYLVYIHIFIYRHTRMYDYMCPDLLFHVHCTPNDILWCNAIYITKCNVINVYRMYDYSFGILESKTI